MDLIALRRLTTGMVRSEHHVSLVQQEANGGKISSAQIDQLSEHPSFRYLSVSGLEQATLEYLVAKFGAQLEAIDFWKCPRVPCLAPLEDLPNLTHVSFYFNQKADRLWNFSRNRNLYSLQFTDFSKLTRLDDLALSKTIKELEFGDAIWSKFGIDSLEPLAELKQLQDLSFSAKKILDGRIEPLAKLVGLNSLHFPSALFTTQQIAWLRSRLPSNLISESLEPTRRIHPPLDIGGKAIDTFVAGFRKPDLDSNRDAKRIAKYENEFSAMLDYFEANLDASADDYMVTKKS